MTDDLSSHEKARQLIQIAMRQDDAIWDVIGDAVWDAIGNEIEKVLRR